MLSKSVIRIFVIFSGYTVGSYIRGEVFFLIVQNWNHYLFAGHRIELVFEDDFAIFCSSTCVDYVELKIGADLSNTGYRSSCNITSRPLAL